MGGDGGFVPELGALGHAEAVLFVDDDEAEVGEPHGVFDDGVGAYEDVDGAVEESGMDFAAFSGGGGSCEQPDVDSDCSGESGYGLEVLCGKDFGWSHQACLGAVVDGYEHAQERHESFAAADVALKQTVHLASGGHVGTDFFYDPLLCSGEFKWKALGVEVVEILSDFAEYVAAQSFVAAA